MGDPEFILLGDAVWLDFINTARGRGGAAARAERMADGAAYHRWTKASRLRSDADTTDFAVIRRFRGRLIRLAEALAAGSPAPTVAITAINELVRRAGGHEQLTREGGVWRLRFALDAAPPALVAIAHSAAASLAASALRIRDCSSSGCTLFFADSSIGGDRRWCSAEPCGSSSWIERRRGALR